MNDDIDPAEAFIRQFPRLFHGQIPRAGLYLPEGWRDLVTDLMRDLDMMLNDRQAKDFKVLQIKQKFGGLRFYWSLGNEMTTVVDIIGSAAPRLDLGPGDPSPLFARITARLQEAEELAARTCQHCGRPANHAVIAGWHATLCPVCHADEAKS